MITRKIIAGQFVLAAAILAGISAPPVSIAQIAGPCAETVTKYCKDVIPGNGRIMKCLNDHRDDQSIACKDWIEEQQKTMQDLMAVCAEDIARWCRNAPADKIGVYFCLIDNHVSLRLDCRSRLGEVRDRMK